MNLNYRDQLKAEFYKRKTLNPSYSLRAFARDLKISAPQLCAVFKGTKGISPAVAMKIIEGLDLSKVEGEIFLRSVEALHSRQEQSKQNSRELLRKFIESEKFQTLKMSNFSVINEWYYLSLLQTFELKDFTPSTEWIANKLGIAEFEVEKALEELVYAGLVKKTAKFFEPSQSFLKTENIPSRAIRMYLQQMLSKAGRALETQTIQERDFSSTVFSMDSKRLPEFKRKLQEFRENFCQSASQSKSKDRVYALSIQFFNVSTNEQKEKK